MRVIGTLEPAQVVVVAAEHVGRPRQQLEGIRCERSPHRRATAIRRRPTTPASRRAHGPARVRRRQPSRYRGSITVFDTQGSPGGRRGTVRLKCWAFRYTTSDLRLGSDVQNRPRAAPRRFLAARCSPSPLCRTPSAELCLRSPLPRWSSAARRRGHRAIAGQGKANDGIACAPCPEARPKAETRGRSPPSASVRQESR